MTRISGEYTEIISASETIYENSPKLSAELSPHVPTPRDLHAEFARALHARCDGVELVPLKRLPRHLFLVGDPDRSYTRSRLYARIDLDHEVVLAKDVDTIRAACFEVCHKTAAQIADEVRAFRSDATMPVTVRWLGESLPRMRHAYGDGQPMFAAISPTHDCLLLLMHAYYVVCPVGDEWMPESE